MENSSGALDEALQRLHATGPEFEGWLSNHAPMAVEVLYWAARHAVLPDHRHHPADRSADEALASVPAVERTGGIRQRFARIEDLPAWPARDVAAPEEARERMRELVGAATRRYAFRAHGAPVMLVHAATAPNAVLRTLPALPRSLWRPSLRAAWAASAAVTAAYASGEAVQDAPAGASRTPQDVFARAAAHGDAHVLKFADTALDVADGPALASVLRAVELIGPDA
ncbi:hypothetical protein [Streptomyces sp. TR02-1]|uniref:hypothetical protein n=1 Tax=Streptomyces sp. TR02-1 TaxID=3385977 RepID=UPI0039A2A111